ncbi:manganese catalase family protein [Cyclobacterium jeungdonense]|uniref:Manganese catalase family protein n=1 Tax=Cyclobacterium jeungdonense TaxID=708087 RepID=A0ABT8C4P6_9BACT|nr:manganese catalase family protein [Cyclobacterium jeungdonense]MDN3686700.1 manganese catalase family protein [Cyclobacterium jeungdonense]
MFHHVKELQFNARVSKPDVRFAKLLLEQFGGPNGELKAAMQYFVQAFGCRKKAPDKFDMLMDIATEEFSHLEIVGATIQMLLTGVNGELKNAADESDLTKMLDGQAAKENYIHDAMVNPQFFLVSGGTPTLTDSVGNPWSASYIMGMGDLTADLRLNIGAETSAKMVYENLMNFTDDVYVKESLRFLMTREVAHFQMFQAALDSIQPNFPPGVLQGDPRFSNKYFNMSKGEDFKGPWNEGKSPLMGEEWQFVDDPHKRVRETNGLMDEKATGTDRTEKSVQTANKKVSASKKEKADKATAPKNGVMSWSVYQDKK